MTSLCRCLTLIWCLGFGLCWPSYGQEAKPQSQADPLSALELRELVARLAELRIARAKIAVLHGHINARDQIDAREKAFWERSLEIERRGVALAERERDIERTRADFYEGAFKAATKKRSRLCTLAKISTLGIARCY